MKKIETIIFDLGRVLMHIDFDAFPNKLEIFSEEEREAYRPQVGKLWKEYETGKMTTEEFIEMLVPIFDGKFSKHKLCEAWDSIIVEENKEIVSLVVEIQKKYATAILSNTSKSHWERSLKISPLVRSFSTVFTSFKLGVMKPDRTMYNLVIQKIGKEPSTILFIDDLKENIDSAIACGMCGIQFISVEQTIDELKKFEIDIL